MAAIDVSCRIVRGVDELVVAVQAALRGWVPGATQPSEQGHGERDLGDRVEGLGAHLERLGAVEAVDQSAPEVPLHEERSETVLRRLRLHRRDR